MAINATKQFVRNLPLRSKLFVFIFTLIIIPLVGSALVINLQINSFISDRTSEVAFESFSKAIPELSETLDNIDNLSLSVFSDKNMQELLKIYREQNPKIDIPLSLNNIDRIENILERYYLFFNKPEYKIERLKYGFAAAIFPRYKSMPFLNSICISQNGNIINQFGDILFAEDESYHDQAKRLDGLGFWTQPYELKNRSADSKTKNVISYLRTIKDLNSLAELGMVRISLEEAELSNMYEYINTWDGSSAYLINKELHIISSTDKTRLGSGFDDQIGNTILETGPQGYFRTEYQGENQWILFQKLDNADWYLVQLIPDHQLNIQVSAVNLVVLVSILFCILFGVLFSYLLNLWVIVPLQDISKEIEKIRTGDFDIKLKSRSKDEIGIVTSRFIDMTIRLKDLINKVYTSQIKEREAELMAMQAQINPHFLYNTLDNIRWMALKENADLTAEQLENLSGLFRYILGSGDEIISIGEELKHLSLYLEIQKNRFRKKLHYSIEMDGDLNSFQTVKLILQPLVENSIEHGLLPKIEQGKIDVSIRRDGDSIIFTVVDNGIGLDAENLNAMINTQSNDRNLFALRNINERIKLRYGNEYGLTMFSEPGKSTTVRVVFPAREFEGNKK